MIIDYRDLAYKYPRLIESTYVTDYPGGLPWFTMASLVIKSMMQGNFNIGHFGLLSDEIFEALSWPVPDQGVREDLASLFMEMAHRTQTMAKNDESPGTWVAVNVRAPSTVVFYKVKDVYHQPELSPSF